MVIRAVSLHLQPRLSALQDPYSQLTFPHRHFKRSIPRPHASFPPNLALSPVICKSVSRIHHLPNCPSGSASVLSELRFLSASLFSQLAGRTPMCLTAFRDCSSPSGKCPDVLVCAEARCALASSHTT